MGSGCRRAVLGHASAHAHAHFALALWAPVSVYTVCMCVDDMLGCGLMQTMRHGHAVTDAVCRVALPVGITVLTPSIHPSIPPSSMATLTLLRSVVLRKAETHRPFVGDVSSASDGPVAAAFGMPALASCMSCGACVAFLPPCVLCALRHHKSMCVSPVLCIYTVLSVRLLRCAQCPPRC